MKPSKPADLRNLTDAELKSRVSDNEKALQDMHFNLAVGHLENPAAMRVVRRDLARMKTILREREIATAAEGAES